MLVSTSRSRSQSQRNPSLPILPEAADHNTHPSLHSPNSPPPLQIHNPKSRPRNPNPSNPSRMWGDGGRVYWGRRPERGAAAAAAAAAGILVAFAWPSSSERDLEPFVELYESLGWSSLICHVDLLTLFLPEKATSLACVVLNKLLKEVRIRPVPIVLTAFSGGSKGCLYKVIQLIEGKCEGKLCLDEYHLVRDCMCGQIYDSSPVDFTTDLGTRFLLHPKPPRVVSWMARTVTSGLDALFLSRIEAERAQYWQTLYSSVSIGPVLIFCSEDDELAPCQIISNFAQCLQEFGGDVKLVKWSSSPHVGHYKYHEAEYKAALGEMLEKSSTVYTLRRKLNGDTTCPVPESVLNLQSAAVSSNESLARIATGPSDHFYLPSSTDHNETRSSGSDQQKPDPFNLPNFNAHGVLGQILFDVCVPENIEGWDIKPIGPLNGRQGFTFGRRQAPFNPFRSIRRSRL